MMRAIRDWISCQFEYSKSFFSEIYLRGSIFSDERATQESNNQGLTVRSTVAEIATGVPSIHNDVDNQASETLSSLQAHDPGISRLSSEFICSKHGDPVAKVEELRLKFLRLVHRLGHFPQNPVVLQVLNRIHLACLIRAGESGLSREGHQNEQVSKTSVQQETLSQSNVEFSFKILLLGKTGTGKSATINSVFGQGMAVTDAFRPVTDSVHEFVGCVHGTHITVVDTPGLFPSHMNQRRNREILLSVKRYMIKSKPDMILYFERLDWVSPDYCDHSLVKLITDTLGSGVWFNTILVMTHSGSPLPEDPDGSPVSYDGYVSQRTNVVQYMIHKAINDARLENPVLLVENHHFCRTNGRGEKVLPNGQAWRLHFLLLCISTKALADANTLLKFQDSFSLRRTRGAPSLPHLLTKFLKPQSNGSQEELDEVFDFDDIDEYDQLPPIKILKKAQLELLTKDQKNDYLDELDYRETLYMKKQWKEKLMRRKDKVLLEDEAFVDDVECESDSAKENRLLPAMSIPLSFDSDSHVYRYCCPVGCNDWLLTRPILDSHSWDHDVGFDGIIVEGAGDIMKNLLVSFKGQMRKEKHDFSLHTECAASCTHLRDSPFLCIGLDLQSTDKNVLFMMAQGDVTSTNLKRNATGCGISLISFGDKMFHGMKIDDMVMVGKRLKLILNGGYIEGNGQCVHGGSIEATFRGIDYSVRNGKISLGLSFVSFEKETVPMCSIKSDFWPCRNMNVSLSLNLNSRKMGQFCVKISTKEHIEIGAIVIFSIFRVLFRYCWMSKPFKWKSQSVGR